MLFAEGREVEELDELDDAYLDEMPDEDAALALFDAFKSTGGSR
jgi:hypothetical protein